MHILTSILDLYILGDWCLASQLCDTVPSNLFYDLICMIYLEHYALLVKRTIPIERNPTLKGTIQQKHQSFRSIIVVLYNGYFSKKSMFKPYYVVVPALLNFPAKSNFRQANSRQFIFPPGIFPLVHFPAKQNPASSFSRQAKSCHAYSRQFIFPPIHLK